MNVIVTDKQPFSVLNPFEVRAYLVDTGWEESRVLPGRGTFWVHPHFPLSELPLPLDQSVGDFADRMRDAAEILSRVEERSVLSVLRDLETAGQDVIRVRLASSEIEDGSIPLEHGVGLMESARNAIYASALATAAKQRRACYQSRPPKEVSDYMSGVRMGQTERGSYVVTIESPIAPELQSQSGTMAEPFTRRVTRTFAQALTALRAAAVRGNAADIENSIGSGVSANLCSALADALRLSGNQGLVEFQVRWARTRRIPEMIPRSISFPSYLGGVICEAATLLKSISEIENFELEGTVYQIRQDTEAIVIGIVDGSYRKVRVTFPPGLRDKIIACFEGRTVLRCVGELRHKGTIVELINARSFEIEEAVEFEAANGRIAGSGA